MTQPPIDTAGDSTPSERPRDRLPDLDVFLLGEGTHRFLHRQLGAQLVDGGVRFAVWAPNARRVVVAGSFDGWVEHEMDGSSSGVWSVWVGSAGVGDVYLYRVTGPDGVTVSGWRVVVFGRGWMRRCRSMRCIWVRGGVM